MYLRLIVKDYLNRKAISDSVFFFLNKDHAGSSLGFLFYKKTSVDEKSFW